MTSRPSRPRRRLAPDVRRAQIVDVAISQISQKGYWGITLAGVAAEVGVTTQGVLHHFAGKTELIIAVLDRFDELGRDLMFSPSSDDIRGAEDFVRATRKVVERNAAQPELIQLYTVLAAESLSATHPAHEFFDERQRRAVRTFERAVGGWHDEPRALALDVLFFLDGLQINWLRDRSIDMPAAWETWIDRRLHDYLIDVR